MEYPIIHLPRYAKKYSGGIETRHLKTKTTYLLNIRTGDVRYAKSFDSYEEAFEMMKQKNIEHDLPIKNKIFEHEDHWAVELTHEMYCRFDIEDREIVEAHTWYFHHKGYAVARVGERKKPMHTLLMNHNPDDGTSIDHITLDNRKMNLRVADQRLQSINRNILRNNTTGIVGVCFRANPQPRWLAVWKEDDGTLRSKSFSVNVYGYDQARQMAIDQRRLVERMLLHYIEAREW